MSDILSLSNPVFGSFVFYATATLVKMMAMSFLTGFARMSRNVFQNAEDGGVSLSKKNDSAVVMNDPVVERVRRNHLNDLENIPMFVLLGLFYLFTNPSATIAIWHFRVFFFGRLFHTICFQMALQPARSIIYMLPTIVNMSLAVQILMSAHGNL